MRYIIRCQHDRNFPPKYFPSFPTRHFLLPMKPENGKPKILAFYKAPGCFAHFLLLQSPWTLHDQSLSWMHNADTRATAMALMKCHLILNAHRSGKEEPLFGRWFPSHHDITFQRRKALRMQKASDFKNRSRALLTRHADLSIQNRRLWREATSAAAGRIPFFLSVIISRMLTYKEPNWETKERKRNQSV